MSNVDTLKGAVSLLVIGGGLLWSAIRKHKKTRKIQDTARSVIASAPQGYVEVQGFAWSAFETIPTRSGFDAVYFSFKLQKEVTRGSGKNKRREWVTVHTHQHSPDFYILDSSGLAMIEPATAELNIASPRTTHWARLNAEERAKIMQHYIQDAVIESFPPSDFLFGIFASKFRVVEEEILNGSPLYVHGDFHTSEGLPTAVKVPVLGLFWDRIFDSVGSRLKNISTLLDKNKDGNVSEQEARDGYSLIAKMSIAKAKLDIHSESSPREFQLCGHLKSSAQHQLLIADAHEHHLVHRLSRFLWLQFSGGAAMVALSIFLILPKETSSFSKPKERSVASAQELQNHLDPVKLHHDCIQGTSLSCENLLDHKHEYKLSTPQIQYYRSRLCSLGRVDACETKK